MNNNQFRNSSLLIISNLSINLSNFLKQVIMAYFLGVSNLVDTLLLAQIVPTIFQAMISGGAGEILVIRKGESDSQHFETLYLIIVLVIITILGIVYIPVINTFSTKFNLTLDQNVLFGNLSLIFVMNMIPAAFISVLRPLLYSKGLYKFFTYTSVISQLAGIIFIVATVKYLGIYSFAISILVSNILNAFWFLYKAELHYKAILSLSSWNKELTDLKNMIRNLFSLSIQTLFNYLGTFWERSLSVKYLTGGYLSSLNYSKTLSEIPNTILFSSVLTTSYIEQVKLYNSDKSAFQKYTNNVYRIIIRFGFLFQLFMMVLAPLIIILIFRRGKFDNSAVESTMLIFSILTIGFLPKLITSFLTRTMYIFGEYRKLLYATILKFLVQLIIMIVLINKITQAIPIAILACNLAIAFFLLVYTKRNISLPGSIFLISKLFVATLISYLTLRIHTYLLHYYIDNTSLKILLLYSPVLIISLFALIYFLYKYELEVPFIKKFITRWIKVKR